MSAAPRDRKESSAFSSLPIPLSNVPRSNPIHTINAVNFDARSANPQAHQQIALVLQKANGVLDFSNLISGEFKNSTLSQFFEFYSQKSGIPQDMLQDLKFVTQFANYTTFIVQRQWDDERSWKTMQMRIKGLFMEARKENPEQENFEVWVYMGDVTKRQVIQDDWIIGM
jgi:hypothetical protein